MSPCSSVPSARLRGLATSASLLVVAALFAACADDAVPAASGAALEQAGAAGAGSAAGSGTSAGGASVAAGAGGTPAAGGTGGTSDGVAGADAGAAGSGETSAGGAGAGQGGAAAGSSAGGSGAGPAGGSGTGATGGASAGEAGAGGSGAGGADQTNACGAAGKTGYALGDVLGPLPVRDCVTGELTTLDEICSASATWVFAAHTHCPTCKATAGFTDDVAKAVANENVLIVHTVYDDNGTSCETWKKTYGLASYPNVRVFADPGGAVFDKVKSQSYTAPSLFLRADRTITRKEHGMSKAAVLAQIDKDLGP